MSEFEVELNDSLISRFKPAIIVSTDFNEPIEWMDQHWNGELLIVSVPIQSTMILFDLIEGVEI